MKTVNEQPVGAPKQRQAEEFPEPELSLPPAAGPEWLTGGKLLLDTAGRLTAVSPELARWLGQSPEALLGKTAEEILSPRCPEIGEALARARTGPGPWTELQLSGSDAGRKCWFHLELARNANGWFLRLESRLPSFQELKETGGGGAPGESGEKQELRLRLLRAESRLEKLIQRWPGVLFSQRADFSFQDVSPKIEDLTGVPPSAWCGQPRRFWDVVHEADIDELRRQCQQAVKTGAGITTTFRIRHVVTGTISYILEHRQAALSKSGLVLGYEGVWLDITRQTIAERRLSAAAWKETLALLTMGLAHDFNNLISGTVSLTELVLAQLGAAHPSTDTLKMIKQSSLQASQLVQRIVQLHRSKAGQREYLDFNQVVAEVVELVRKVLPRRIRVATEPAQASLPVYLDAVEFRQVVLNLALNAADAMPDRGALTFRVSAHTTPLLLINSQGQFPRLPCVCLSVQDTGSGINPRHLPHLFDPFFTTKPLTKGSGLGLYNARLFVESHGGAISVESTLGAGATFHLWLPQADFTEAERMSTEDAGRRRTLLLVGQPGMATDLMIEFLRTHNYCVVATHTAARALELLTSEESTLEGLIVLADPADAALLGLVSEARERRLSGRVVLQLIGGSVEHVEQRILDKAHLVLASDLDEKLVLEQLSGLFAAAPHP